MKGFVQLIAAVLLILILGGIFIFIISTQFRYNLWYTTKFYYESSIEDLSLLTLLNSRCYGERVYKIISERHLFPIDEARKECITDNLNKSTASDCFRLYILDESNNEETIASYGDCELGKPVCYRIVKPYSENKLTELVCLQVRV